MRIEHVYVISRVMDLNIKISLFCCCSAENRQAWLTKAYTKLRYTVQLNVDFAVFVPFFSVYLGNLLDTLGKP